ncbi:MAG: hypothetical protein LBP22_05045 [Deltaproteobacteria bacterium]|jgi:hypothetical protein|nr:hypothetical protein [Deltaproteobacteria bacterium]
MSAVYFNTHLLYNLSEGGKIGRLTLDLHQMFNQSKMEADAKAKKEAADRKKAEARANKAEIRVKTFEIKYKDLIQQYNIFINTNTNTNINNSSELSRLFYVLRV